MLASLTFKSSPISPIVFSLLRDVIACACFIPTLLFSQRRVPPEEKQLAPLVEHWGLFAALGLLGVFSQMLGALSISLTSALVYGLFSPSVPVITILISFLAGVEVFRPREAASWAKAAGIVACLGGAAAIVLLGSGGSHGSGGGGTLGGYAYLFAATVAKASYPVLQKHMLSRFGYSSLMLVTWACAWTRLGGCPTRRRPPNSLTPSGPYADVLGATLIALNASTSAVTSSAWAMDSHTAGVILYSGLFSSFFAYGAMAFVNARLGPVTVMAFYPLQSVITPVLSSIFLGSTVQPADIGGGGAIVAGLALCLWAKVAEGSAPANGLVGMDEDAAEAATVVLSPRDLAALAEALSGGGGGGGAEEEGAGSGSEAVQGGAGARVGAAALGGGRLRRAKTLAAVMAPILHRSLSRASLAPSPLAAAAAAGEASALLGGGAGGGGLTRSASVLSGVRRRAATRGMDVVVGFL